LRVVVVKPRPGLASVRRSAVSAAKRSGALTTNGRMDVAHPAARQLRATLSPARPNVRARD